MTATVADVRAIYTTPKSDSEVQVFLDTAQLWADEQLADKGLSTARLDKIVTYLAAHYLVVTEEKGSLKSEKIGQVSESFQAPSNAFLGFNTTRFGQQAVLLDTSGTLATVDMTHGKQAQFEVV